MLKCTLIQELKHTYILITLYKKERPTAQRHRGGVQSGPPILSLTALNIPKYKKVKKMLDKEFLYCYNGVKERKVIKMNSKELVRKLIEEKGISQADVAATMNITPAALWDRISSKKTSSLSVKKLNEILRALGYEIVIMPRAKAGKIENAYVVEE